MAHVYALDPATGKLKWGTMRSPHVIAFAANRGIGLLDGNVHIGTLDGRLIALNVETGLKVWDKVTPSQNECGFWTAEKDAVYIAGQFYLGGTFPKLVGPKSLSGNIASSCIAV